MVSTKDRFPVFSFANQEQTEYSFVAAWIGQQNVGNNVRILYALLKLILSK